MNHYLLVPIDNFLIHLNFLDLLLRSSITCVRSNHWEVYCKIVFSDFKIQLISKIEGCKPGTSQKVNCFTSIFQGFCRSSGTPMSRNISRWLLLKKANNFPWTISRMNIPNFSCHCQSLDFVLRQRVISQVKLSKYFLFMELKLKLGRFSSCVWTHLDISVLFSNWILTSLALLDDNVWLILLWPWSFWCFIQNTLLLWGYYSGCWLVQ